MPNPARKLILGRMPINSLPELCIPAGAWCFAGREDFFPHWQQRFTFAPEPLWDTPELEHAARAAQALAANTLPVLADIIHRGDEPDASRLHAGASLRPAPLPPAYWELLLGPWAIAAAQVIIDRWRRVQAMLAIWGQEPFTVELLPQDCVFAFGTEEDFLKHGALGHSFNHWLFSRLLDAVWPAAWTKVMLPARRRTYWERHEQNKKPTWADRRRALLLRLPFSCIRGATLGQTLRLSLSLLAPAHGPDRSRPLSSFSTAASGVATGLPCPALPLMLSALPLSLQEMSHPEEIPRVRHPRCRVIHMRTYDDAAYRQRVAIWRASGHRLVVVQQDGHEGHARVSCAAPFLAYTQHACTTWGWTRHSGYAGNFVPLPSFQLSAVHNAWRGGGEHWLFTSKGMPALACQMDSLPTPLQWEAYRRLKSLFFAALPQAMQSACRYYPHAPRPTLLDDAAWVLQRFPHAHLGAADFVPQLLRCRLMVSDHYGRALAMAMAANVPTIMYWNRDAWPLSGDSDDALRMLEAAGIWFAHPEAAARQLAQVWDNPAQWWQSPERQQARAAWCARFALSVETGITAAWRTALRRL